MPPPRGDLKADTNDLTGHRVGRFVVQRRLGAGGMGEVYYAEDTQLKRPVALKRVSRMLREDLQSYRSLLKEAERACSLNHPSIASVYDVLEEDGELYVVMEYVEGETLRQQLYRRMQLKDFMPLALQIAEALAAAHGKGVVHRDIKPENLMIRRDGLVKVLDFGVAQRLPASVDGTSPETLTSEALGRFAGTLAYMAPEVLLERKADLRADLFSLGVVFYEALTGRHPFRARGYPATVDRILHEIPPPVSRSHPDVPDGLERVVGKLLAKDPDQRYATASDLLVDLRAVQRGTASSAAPSRWRRYLVVATFATIVILGILLFPLMRQGEWWRFGRGILPARKHLAVLPFEAIGGEPQDRFFCDGLTATVTAKLTQLTTGRFLAVLPASEVRAREVSDLEKARTEFGANLALEGSCQRFGETIRVNLVLVDTLLGRQLRSDTLTAADSKPFDLQDQVARSAIGMLDLVLQPQEVQSLAARGTDSSVAYGYFLEGRGYLQNYDKAENVERAVDAFRRALEADPDYAGAQAGLGEAYRHKFRITNQARWIQLAISTCERAVALDSRGAPGRICLGEVSNESGRYEQAVEQFQRALDVEPTSDQAYRGLALAYERLGRREEAERTYNKAIDLRPHYWAGYVWLGNFYVRQSFYPQAARQFQQAAELAPENLHAYRNLGGVYYYMGRYQEAVAALEKANRLLPTASAYSNLGMAFLGLRRFGEAVEAFEQSLQLNSSDYRVAGNLARAYDLVGQQERSRQAYQRAVGLGKERLRVNPIDADAHLMLADYYAMLDERVDAFRYLETALQLRPEEGEFLFWAAMIHEHLGRRAEALDFLEQAAQRCYSPVEIRDAPEFDNLRQDPRFQRLSQLLEKGGLCRKESEGKGT